MRDKLSQGWRYGQPRDDERKIHPDLLPWAALSEADKDKDRNAIRTLPDDPARRGLPDPPSPAGLLAGGARRYVWRNRRYGLGEPDRPPDQLGVGRVVVHLLVAEHEGGTA